MIADLHIHSRYSQGCSRNIDLDNLEKYAKIKGVDLLGTGDFTHPSWIKEIDEKLTEENGILKSKSGFPFLWQTEISLMYSQDGKGRRVHHVVLAPNREVVNQITEALVKKAGRVLDYDGRPIFGFSSIEFVDVMRSISDKIEIIPAHIWTSWFGILGSKSGFDSVQECFQEKSKYIHAIETGLSSDPPMNWRISNLDKYNLVSFSDNHSFWPWRLSREATIFDCDIDYDLILKAIRTGDGLKGTVEVKPEYGKYHWDGHRNCGICLSPKESKELNRICPKCGKPLTIGVEYRVGELADRDEGFVRKDKKEFFDVIPLTELIVYNENVKQLGGVKVWKVYNQLIEKFGNEYNILLKVSEEELVRVAGERLAKLILLNRNMKLNIKPGYDGVYGEIIENGFERSSFKKVQKNLGDF